MLQRNNRPVNSSLRRAPIPKVEEKKVNELDDPEEFNLKSEIFDFGDLSDDEKFDKIDLSESPFALETKAKYELVELVDIKSEYANACKVNLELCFILLKNNLFTVKEQSKRMKRHQVRYHQLASLKFPSQNLSAKLRFTFQLTSAFRILKHQRHQIELDS